jgi:hypothetical protein
VTPASVLALRPQSEVEPTLQKLEQVRALLQEVQTPQEARHIYGVRLALWLAG